MQFHLVSTFFEYRNICAKARIFLSSGHMREYKDCKKILYARVFYVMIVVQILPVSLH